MSCRVLIWSERTAFVRAIRSLAHREDLVVIGIARTGDAALACVRVADPDVVLVDRETKERHPEMVLRLMDAGTRTKIVVMDLVDEAVRVLECRRATAATVRDLVRAIQGDLAQQLA